LDPIGVFPRDLEDPEKPKSATARIDTVAYPTSGCYDLSGGKYSVAIRKGETFEVGIHFGTMGTVEIFWTRPSDQKVLRLWVKEEAFELLY
jgi:hypothetical protein